MKGLIIMLMAFLNFVVITMINVGNVGVFVSSAVVFIMICLLAGVLDGKEVRKNRR